MRVSHVLLSHAVSGSLAFLHSTIGDNINNVANTIGFEVGGKRNVSPLLEAPAESVSDRC